MKVNYLNFNETDTHLKPENENTGTLPEKKISKSGINDYLTTNNVAIQFKKYADILLEDIIDEFVNQYKPNMVPRIIALIDMDAFFTQVQHKICNIPKDKSLVVLQRNTVIAVNYPGKARGIKRGMKLQEALSIYPDLAVPKSTYYNDEIKDNNSYNIKKISLEIYREASREIFNNIANYIPKCKIQISSIDEAYIDLSENMKLILEYIVLVLKGEKSDYKGIEDLLCLTGEEILNYQLNIVKNYKDMNFMKCLMDLFPELFDEKERSKIFLILFNSYKEKGKSSLFDIYGLKFDELLILLGATIIYRVRNRLLQDLDYTCSAGISINKLLAKLVCSLRKPNGQSVLFSRWINQYMGILPILKLRLLGGKLGKLVSEKLPMVRMSSDLLQYNKSTLIKLFGERNGEYLYNTCRGIDLETVIETQHCRSILSSKNFYSGLDNLDEIFKWLYIFSSELSERSKNLYKTLKIRPTKVGVTIRNKLSQNRTRMQSINYSDKTPNADIIYETAKSIFLNKFYEPNNSNIQKKESDINTSYIKDIFPCKYLGVSLYNLIKDDSKFDILQFDISNNKTKNKLRYDENIIENYKNENKNNIQEFDNNSLDILQNTKIINQLEIIPINIKENIVELSSDSDKSENETYNCNICYKILKLSDKQQHDKYHLNLKLQSNKCQNLIEKQGILSLKINEKKPHNLRRKRSLNIYTSEDTLKQTKLNI
ncbi:putative DNA polymerase eta [Cryptosporidium serpentis]